MKNPKSFKKSEEIWKIIKNPMNPTIFLRIFFFYILFGSEQPLDLSK